MPERRRHGQGHAAKRERGAQRRTASESADIESTDVLDRLYRFLDPHDHMTDVALEVVFHERSYTMSGLAVLLQRFDRLWADVVQLHAYGSRSENVPTPSKVPRPLIQRVSLNSPLILTIGGSPALLGTLLLLRYLLRNSKAIGQFVPQMVQGWHESWTHAERAKADRALAKSLDAGRSPALLPVPDSPSEELVEQLVRDGEALFEAVEPAKVEVSANLTLAEDD